MPSWFCETASLLLAHMCAPKHLEDSMESNTPYVPDSQRELIKHMAMRLLSMVANEIEGGANHPKFDSMVAYLSAIISCTLHMGVTQQEASSIIAPMIGDAITERVNALKEEK